MFFSEPKKSEEICDMSPVATPYPIHPPTGSNNFPPKVFKQFLFLVYFNNINISIFMTECQCISPLLSDNKVTSRLSPLDLRTRTRQIPFSATEYCNDCNVSSSPCHLYSRGAAGGGAGPPGAPGGGVTMVPRARGKTTSLEPLHLIWTPPAAAPGLLGDAPEPVPMSLTTGGGAGDRPGGPGSHCAVLDLTMNVVSGVVINIYRSLLFLFQLSC